MLIPVLKVFHLSFWLLSEWIEDNLSAVLRRSDDKTYPYLSFHSSPQLTNRMSINESSIIQLDLTSISTSVKRSVFLLTNCQYETITKILVPNC